MLMETLLMVGVSQFYLGNFASARGAIQRAISDYDDRERTRLWSLKTGHDASLTTRGYLAQTLWYLGYPDQALALDREMISLAQQCGDPFRLTYVCYQSCCLLFQCQMGAELEAAIDSQLHVSNVLEFHWYQAMQGIFTAGAMILAGRAAEAIPLLREGVAKVRAMGSERNLPQYFGMLGDACLRAGLLSDARDALSEASALIEKNRERTVEAEIQRLHGELLVAQSDANDTLAEEQFRAAIATARSQDARSWELRATLSLAQLLKRQGRPGEASRELRAVFDQFDEGFSTPDLMAAAAFLVDSAAA
jgi:predicted ATPase